MNIHLIFYVCRRELSVNMYLVQCLDQHPVICLFPPFIRLCVVSTEFCSDLCMCMWPLCWEDPVEDPDISLRVVLFFFWARVTAQRDPPRGQIDAKTRFVLFHFSVFLLDKFNESYRTRPLLFSPAPVIYFRCEVQRALGRAVIALGIFSDFFSHFAVPLWNLATCFWYDSINFVWPILFPDG